MIWPSLVPMHRRELSIRLGDAISPSDGGRLGASAMVRIDVQIRRELREQLTALATGRYPGELNDLVGRALDAGLEAIVPRLRRSPAKGRPHTAIATSSCRAPLRSLALSTTASTADVSGRSAAASAMRCAPRISRVRRRRRRWYRSRSCHEAHGGRGAVADQGLGDLPRSEVHPGNLVAFDFSRRSEFAGLGER